MSSDAELEYDDDSEAEVSPNSALRKKLRDAEQKAQKAEERAATNEAAARRVAFMDAKVPESPQSKFFMDHYDGDLSPEAIRTAAQANGFMAAQEAETQAEIDQITGMSDTAQGAESPERNSSEEAMDREMREAAEEAARTGGPDAVGEAIAAVLQRHNRPTTFDTQ